MKCSTCKNRNEKTFCKAGKPVNANYKTCKQYEEGEPKNGLSKKRIKSYESNPAIKELRAYQAETQKYI